MNTRTYSSFALALLATLLLAATPARPSGEVAQVAEYFRGGVIAEASSASFGPWQAPAVVHGVALTFRIRPDFNWIDGLKISGDVRLEDGRLIEIDQFLPVSAKDVGVFIPTGAVPPIAVRRLKVSLVKYEQSQECWPDPRQRPPRGDRP